MRKGRWLVLVAAVAGATSIGGASFGTGVPIAGFSPIVGIGLTDEFKDGNSPDYDFFAELSPAPGGPLLGASGAPYFDLALLDTGANGSLLTAAADAAFDLAGNGFDGTVVVPIGGATGSMDTVVSDPLGIYATGLANRLPSPAALVLDENALVGQTNVALLTMPPESKLPNVLGLPFASQYATRIRSDQPQIFEHAGRTVRTPQIEFLPLGSGGQGIQHRAPFSLEPSASFNQPPLYIFNFDNIFNGMPLHENPTGHTHLNDGTASRAALFLSVDVANGEESLDNFDFFFDTGADVTVVSELNADRLGFDVVDDEPEFTIAIVGSGGARLDVPGFFVDEFTVESIGGTLTATNVPVIVLNVTNPADPGNFVDGIVGMNLFAGRNLVIDPDPSVGGGNQGPHLYIGDPVTVAKNWTTVAASGNWATGGNWNGGSAPTTLGVANVRHVAGGNQTAVVDAEVTAWELNVSGTAASMTVRVDNGARLTTFGGVNIESGGVLQLAGGTLDAQFVEIVGGTLTGNGLVTTGSGPIHGQVENRAGTLAPGDGVGTLQIEGRFASSAAAALAIELGGTAPGSGYDQLVIDGAAALGGTLSVSLVDLGGGVFAPSIGSEFTILTATDGVSGTFATLFQPVGYNLDLVYDDDRVQLVVGAPGDYNDDGTVNAADYTVWRDTLGSTTDLAADGNGNRMIDAGDYAWWKSHFGDSLGAGSAGAATTVPEPASTLLSAIAVVLFACRRLGRQSSLV